MLCARATTPLRDKLPYDVLVLAHDERFLRRRVVTLQHGDDVLVDLARATALAHGDRLLLEDGRQVEIIAADEELMEVRAGGGVALIELAWHIGNRHLPAQLEAERIVLLRDHVVREMLRGLGASVRNVREAFEPARGAYHRHEHVPAEGLP